MPEHHDRPASASVSARDSGGGGCGGCDDRQQVVYLRRQQGCWRRDLRRSGGNRTPVTSPVVSNQLHASEVPPYPGKSCATVGGTMDEHHRDGAAGPSVDGEAINDLNRTCRRGGQRFGFTAP